MRDRGVRRQVRTYLRDAAKTTGRAVLECGHERAVPRGATWYWCGECDPDAPQMPAAAVERVTRLPVRGGDPIELRLVLAISKSRRASVARLSDGQSIRVNGDVAVGEYLSSSGSRRYGAGFVRAWLAMPSPPRASVAPRILDAAGFDDMPAEALVTWLSRVSREGLSRISADSVVECALSSAAVLGGVSLGHVLRPGIREGSTGMTSGYALWHEPLTRAAVRWMRTQNLVEPDLLEPGLLDVPLDEVWEWDREQRRHADARAGALRAAVAERYGFKAIKYRHGYLGESLGTVWIRGEVDDDLGTFHGNLHKLKENLKKSGKNVAVVDDLQVFVCGEHRCVVEAKSADLPHDDQVVRRMLAVATSHREAITTLQGDLPLLEELFTPYRDARVWDLANAKEEE